MMLVFLGLARHVRGDSGCIVSVCFHTTGIVMDSCDCVKHIDVRACNVPAMYEANLALLSPFASRGIVMDFDDDVTLVREAFPR